MHKKITGGCLCGEVTFSLNNTFKTFFQCHCDQCKQLTGSAFASNAFTDVTNIRWHSGQDNITEYSHPTRGFSKSFCRVCGSALPFVNKSKTSLIVPVGSLSENPDIVPQANIFVSEEAPWLKEGINAKRFDGFPE